MPEEIAARLKRAQSKQTGVRLTPEEVDDLCQQIESLAVVVQRLNVGEVVFRLPASYVADLIADVLCFHASLGELLIGRHASGYYLRRRGDREQIEAPTLLEALDAWRRSNGRSPVEEVPAAMPGTEIYAQLVADEKTVDNS